MSDRVVNIMRTRQVGKAGRMTRVNSKGLKHGSRPRKIIRRIPPRSLLVNRVPQGFAKDIVIPAIEREILGDGFRFGLRPRDGKR